MCRGKGDDAGVTVEDDLGKLQSASPRLFRLFFRPVPIDVNA